MSRLFSFIEARKITLSDYTAVEFSLSTDGAVIRHDNLDTSLFNVRVFNEDFLADNLQFDSGSAKTIVTVGKINKELLAEIKTLETTLDTEGENLKKLQKEKDKLPKCEKILKDAGDKVVATFAGTKLATGRFAGRNYNASKISALISTESISQKTASNGIISDPEDIKKKLDVIQNSREKVLLKVPSLPDMSSVYQDINNVLALDVQFEEIAELSSDPSLKNWIEQGIGIHEKSGTKRCLFCDNDLSPEKIARYKKYFTDDLGTLRATIHSIQNKLQQNNYSSLQKDGFKKADLFPDQVSSFESLESNLNTHLNFIEKSVNRAVELLKNKDEGLHQHQQMLECILYPKTAFADAKNCLDQIEEIIKQQNLRLNDIENEINAAAKNIELHTVSSHLIDTDYFSKKKQCDDFSITFSASETKISTIKSTIALKKGSLQNVTDSIGKMNAILDEFFGNDFIRLEVGQQVTDSASPVYVLKRRGKDCRRLSQGEKSVIGLIYFLMKLEEDGFDKRQSCIVIDDPVDSQDSAFMFRAFALLKRYTNDVGQLVVLTHSFEYFNLVRDWLSCDDKKDRSALFTIQYNKDPSHEVTISDLSKLLKDYKSEYQYLFQLLYDYRFGRTSLDEPLVANVARKLLEYFASFKWSCKTTEHFKTIIDDAFVGQSSDMAKKVAGEFVYKFVNEYSHGQDFSRQITSVALEAKEIAKKTLDFICYADGEHYKSLRGECDSRSSGS